MHESYFIGQANVGTKCKGYLLLGYEAGKARGTRNIIYCDVILLFMNRK